MALAAEPKDILELAALRRRLRELEARCGGRAASDPTPPAEELSLASLVGDCAGAAVLVLALDGAVVAASEPAAGVLGWSRAELLGQNAWALVHPDDVPALAALRSAPADRRLPVEARVRGRGGAHRWIELRFGLHAPGGALRHFVCTVRDVEEEHARDRGEGARAQAPVVPASRGEQFVLMSDDGKLLACDRRYLGALGGRAAEMGREGWAALERAATDQLDDREAYAALREQERRSSDAATWGELTTRSGRVLERHSVPAVDPSGRAVGRAVLYRDVTERRRGEEELRARVRQQLAVSRLSHLALEAGAAAPLLDGATALAASALRVELCGYFELDLPGSSLALRGAVGFRHCAAGSARVALSHGSIAATVVALDAPVVCAALSTDPSVNDALLAAEGGASAVGVPVRSSARTFGVLVACAREPRAFGPDDVVFLETVANVVSSSLAHLEADERRQAAEAEQAFSDRMRSVGMLAAGVAHELNSPLAYVLANLKYLEERFEELRPDSRGGAAAEMEDAAAEAIEGAERMRRIVQGLKTFSCGERMPESAVDLRRVLERCLELTAPEVERRGRLVRELRDVPPVRGHEGRLAQAFVNLVANAVEALPEGEEEENEVRVACGVAGDGRVWAEVTDSGCGIPAEHLKRIFDPFFTTKPPGVGTGLGLAMCRGIVAAAGGSIEVASEVGRGSTFRVLLRTADEPRPLPDGSRAVVDPAGLRS